MHGRHIYESVANIILIFIGGTLYNTFTGIWDPDIDNHSGSCTTLRGLEGLGLSFGCEVSVEGVRI